MDAQRPTGERRDVLTRVIDALGRPPQELTPVGDDGATAAPPLTLPDTRPGLPAFARLIQPGHRVLLIAGCTGLTTTTDEIAAYLGAALYRVPVEMIAREDVTGHGLPRFPWATWSA